MRILLSALLLLSLASVSAKELKDTIRTPQNDQIILRYEVTTDENRCAIDFSRPRIIPSSFLNNACKGEIDKLKVVIFDKIGDFGKVKWTGITPSTFMIPNGLTHAKTHDGFYILGESQPIEFKKNSGGNVKVSLPVYIAIYDKKQHYRIVTSGKRPLPVSFSTEASTTGLTARRRHTPETETQRIAVTSSIELESDNNDITAALSSINLVNDLLSRETGLPFSQTLQMEIYNLQAVKNRVNDPEIKSKIDDVLLLCSDKEKELTELQKQADFASQAEEQALLQQQKQEADAQKKEAEEKARIQEEKQQKRTLWMIIGGVILGVLGFIGNALFKHFRDIRNQKSIMQMQESIVRQAEHETARRSREIIRNKAHTYANKGRRKLQESVTATGKHLQGKNRRSI